MELAEWYMLVVVFIWIQFFHPPVPHFVIDACLAKMG
jgi:hypothetical protein